MKILFISRAYPPIIGGIENQNYGISKALSNITSTKIIANKKGKSFLPLFLPYLGLRMLLELPKVDAIVFGDGVLSPLGAFFKLVFPKKKFVSIIHGLDITFAHNKSLMGKIYRTINIPSLKKLDKLIMVGNQTIEEAAKVGIPRGKCVFIPNGVETKIYHEEYTRKDLERVLGLDISNKKIILRVGRFVKHKGVEWFVRNVMPKLPENYFLVAAGGVVTSKAGDEDYYPRCLKAVEENQLQDRVKFFPNIPQTDLEILFNTADLYISPNIKVPGTMEGFGINAIEAAFCRRIVVASSLEGLKDAIIDQSNGFLVEPEDSESWASKIEELLEKDNLRNEFGRKARKYVIDNFSWEGIAKKYIETISNIN